MNNKELFIENALDNLAGRFPQSPNATQNRNLAFEIFAIATVLGKTPEEVFSQIVARGSKDGGFDGIYFENLGDTYVMHVFQCKNAPGMQANQIDKFRNDFRDVFPDGNRVGRQQLEDVQAFIDEYRQITADGYLIQPRLYFVFNGEKQDGAYGNNQSIYQAYHDPAQDFLILDAGDLYRMLAQTASKRKEVRFTLHPESSNISVLDNQGLYTYAIENIRAANCRILAQELCELIDAEVSVNGSYDTLFEENIRTYLGLRSARANARMNETLASPEDAIFFPFLNNGLTMICDQLTIPRAAQDRRYLLPVVNPQIVNGLQTSMVLYHNYRADPARLREVYLNVRIYETKDAALIEKITDATNTQSPINYRDKISNKGFNAYAERAFANIGVRYVLKRGDQFGKGAERGKPSVDSDTALKYWYATFFEKPEVAKNSISGVLQYVYDAATNAGHPLHRLFANDINSPIYRQLISAYRLYAFVQSKKNGLRIAQPIVDYADELLCYGMYKQLGQDWGAYHEPARLEEAYADALERISRITAEDQRMHAAQGRGFYFNSFFKRPKCRIDYNRDAGILESESLIEDLQAS